MSRAVIDYVLSIIFVIIYKKKRVATFLYILARKYLFLLLVCELLYLDHRQFAGLFQYGKEYEFDAPVKLLDKHLHAMAQSIDEQVVVVSQVSPSSCAFIVPCSSCFQGSHLLAEFL